MTSCISPPLKESQAKPIAGADEVPTWSTLVEQVRAHCSTLPPEEADELRRWADLLEGMAEMQRRDCR